MATDEFERISRIAKIIGPNRPDVVVGIGDDTAVVRPRVHPLLLCSDAMVEGVHFDRRWTSATDLGHKALATCLSDIAAMNGDPLYVLVSLAMPADIDESYIDEFYRAASDLARKHGCEIIGGDLTSSPNGVFVDVSCVGESAYPALRSQAKPGDVVAVSGAPGSSAAGLYALKTGKTAGCEELVRAHIRPEPRFDLLPVLRSSPTLCHALIDVSDGLSSELNHLASKSKVDIEIEASKIPLHPEALALARSEGRDPLAWALSGGEDYELLVTLDRDALEKLGGALKGFTVIGQVVGPGESVSILDEHGRKSRLEATGFNHFKRPSRGP